MDPSTTPEMYTIFCMVEGDESLFLVDIKENQTVGHLKDEIFKKIPFTLKKAEARHFKLYKIDVEASTSNKFREAVKSLKLDESEDLFTCLTLSTVFAPSGPSDTTYILVRLPPGESIDPKVGGAVAETKPRPHTASKKRKRTSKIHQQASEEGEDTDMVVEAESSSEHVECKSTWSQTYFSTLSWELTRRALPCRHEQTRAKERAASFTTEQPTS